MIGANKFSQHFHILYQLKLRYGSYSNMKVETLVDENVNKNMKQYWYTEKHNCSIILIQIMFLFQLPLKILLSLLVDFISDDVFALLIQIV